MVKKSDQQLIALLQDNARRPVSELARELGLSRSTVQGRIRKLEQQGILRGYSVVLGDEYLNEQIAAHVLIKVQQKLTGATSRQLRELPQTRALYAISGDYDLIAIIQADSTETLNQTLDEIGNLEGVERTNSSVILETKFVR
ncbi:MAG: Lrp/AsnC family transcriptional regulator [Gammaproteobacteria bacterium]